MRLSIATFVWTGSFTDDDLGLVQKVADLGYDELEVVFDGSGGVTAERLRDRLADAGLGAGILAFALPERDISAADGEAREAGVSYLTDALDFAATIGAPTIGGPIAHPPGRARPLAEEDRAAERARAVESLRALGDIAGERGIAVAVEQLSRYDSDMFNTADESLAFLAEVDHPSVGLLLDTFHMQMEERSQAEAVRAAADKLLHFHAVESHRGQLGTGQIPWDEVFAALAEIDYQGAVSLESFASSGPEMDGLVNMWRPWFADSEEFASRSLEFIRNRAGS